MSPFTHCNADLAIASEKIAHQRRPLSERAITMGVKGLHSYLENKLPASQHITTLPALADAAFKAKTAPTIVVDGMALIRKMYTTDLEWVVGGQYQDLLMNVKAFVQAFESCGLRLVVFIDGGVDDAKLSEWQSRRAKDLQKVEKVVAALARGEEPPSSAWMPPPNISKAVGGAFATHSCEVYYTAGEADRELASYCASKGCCGVLAKDSDFFVLPVAAYLNLDTLALYTSPPQCTVYRRDAVEAALALPSAFLPLLGSLVGNDFVPTHLLSDFHRVLLPGRHASGAPLIEAAARHVAAAATAAGWAGPWPCTPLLWCALDWKGTISAEARGLVERSLEQYAVEEGFRELPPSLLERASGTSSQMLRRFRRGRLDSAVFTSATRQAIWRGPSIDDPEAPPTILASRPIRLETYAACVRRPKLRDEVAGAGGALSSTAEAGGAAGGVCVSEHIIYHAQAQHGAAEHVDVPPQLASCEVMWTLPPAAQCACMLRAIGRASRADREVADLDPAAVCALGPLALVVLATRFMRRHGLVSRAVALVVLCQGLVMAWLAQTRQLLPPALRKRQRSSRGATLQAAHFASLVTRVTTDLGIFNSACGEPLSLRGPWEWFDGVLFESMLSATSKASANAQADFGPSGCWAGLLRGDAQLLKVFNLLRRLALGIEPGEAGASTEATAIVADGDSIVAAAAAWRGATAPR